MNNRLYKFYKNIPTCLILAAIFYIGLCGKAHAGEITDMAGRKVVIPDVIRKVYSTSPPATCMMYALAPDLIAGRNYAYRAEEKEYISERMKSLPVIGGWFGQGRTPNLETLMKVNPDIILVWQWEFSAILQKTEQTIKPLGFPIVYIKMDSLYDYPRAFEFLGKLFKREERSARLIEYANRTLMDMDTLKATVPDEKRVSVYYAEGMDGFSTDCSASVHAELIPLCCGKNVHVCEAKDIFGMERISAEQVVQYNPEVILVREAAFYNRIYKDPRWKNIQAVKDSRVFRIPRTPFDWFDRPPSFMRLLGAKWLMNKLYPEQYPMDMIKETQAFYRLFLNISLDRQTAAKILFL